MAVIRWRHCTVCIWSTDNILILCCIDYFLVASHCLYCMCVVQNPVSVATSTDVFESCRVQIESSIIVFVRLSFDFFARVIQRRASCCLFEWHILLLNLSTGINLCLGNCTWHANNSMLLIAKYTRLYYTYGYVYGVLLPWVAQPGWVGVRTMSPPQPNRRSGGAS